MPLLTVVFFVWVRRRNARLGGHLRENLNCVTARFLRLLQQLRCVDCLQEVEIAEAAVAGKALKASYALFCRFEH